MDADAVSRVIYGFVGLFGVGGLGTLGFRLYAQQARAALSTAEGIAKSLRDELDRVHGELAEARRESTAAREATQQAVQQVDELRRASVDRDRRYLAALRYIAEVLRTSTAARDGEPARQLPDLPDELRRDVRDLT